jgi:hypothetical protein
MPTPTPTAMNTPTACLTQLLSIAIASKKVLSRSPSRQGAREGLACPGPAPCLVLCEVALRHPNAIGRLGVKHNRPDHCHDCRIDLDSFTCCCHCCCVHRSSSPKKCE